MPGNEFFARHGLYVAPGFLPPNTCAKMCSELRTVSGEFAPIDRRGETVLDRNRRRTKAVQVSAGTHLFIEKQFHELIPRLREYFNVALEKFATPQFLLYKRGYFFIPHQDKSDDIKSPNNIRDRRVSAVIFLNGAAEKPRRGRFCGGELTLFGLIPEPPWENCGFPLRPEEGLLVAFRSELYHQVTPVTHGSRYSVVTWFS